MSTHITLQRYTTDDEAETVALWVVTWQAVYPDSGYIDQLVVARNMWGGPVAPLLLGEAKRLSPAALDLRVMQDNARAIRFYEKHGFAKVGEAFNKRLGKPTFIMRWRPA